VFFRFKGTILNINHIAVIRPPTYIVRGGNKDDVYRIIIEGAAAKTLWSEDYKKCSDAEQDYNKLVDVIISYNYNRSTDVNVQADPNQTEYKKDIGFEDTILKILQKK